MWIQKSFSITARSQATKVRGFHLITGDVVAQLPEIKQINTGILHLFIQHTSASLTLNENAAPEVRTDFETFFTDLVPEGDSRFLHQDEGPDDLPAHIKASLLGSSLSLPITNGRLNLGTWQGIYLCEHRNHASARTLVATIHGE